MVFKEPLWAWAHKVLVLSEDIKLGGGTTLTLAVAALVHPLILVTTTV